MSIYKPDYTRKHGEARVGGTTRLYLIWLNMRETLGTKQEFLLGIYGGLPEYKPWRDYRKFRKWALGHGYAGNLMLARIDKGKGFSLDNCRWQKHPNGFQVENNKGEKFDSITAAARFYHRAYSRMYRAVHLHERCAGLYWHFVDLTDGGQAPRRRTYKGELVYPPENISKRQ